ncbi:MULTISPECIES: oligopeptide/dipeptide ABC transporter ATP-binding protein [Sediminimonas]|uniref:oligopeptide/dipeptide ABC transporter ATP-binding protein n=1 Tax=Sediminimonas TaxID=659427 RepID=UPI000410D325|nr:MULTISPECIES: ABC transporter ATP-binding protein [Sediminimonas]MDR9483767.1 ABC transporter ATP-binding protein [Sediminimonas sp.]
MTQPILTLKDVVVEFPGLRGLKGLMAPPEQRHVQAVAGISLDVQPGETVAIVGESGSGKTTLARAINGLVPLAGGEVWFDGMPLHERPDWHAVRRRVAMMFQDPSGSLSPRKTVRDLVLEPFAIHGIKLDDPGAKAADLLATAGLGPDFLARYPHQLSGGQARRVGVARALALDPAMVLADEPTAGLDVSIQGEILNLLNRIKAQHGLTTVIITHNLNILRHVADRVAVMYLGRIVELGEVEQILSTPAHPYTRALMAANPEPDPTARHERITLKGETPALNARPSGCEFHPRCPVARPECAERAPLLGPTPGAGQVSCHFPIHKDEMNTA